MLGVEKQVLQHGEQQKLEKPGLPRKFGGSG